MYDPRAEERPVIDVWRIALDAATAASGEGCLSPDEKTRADRFHFARDRERFIASHGALRHILARYRACAPESLRFARRAAGKPYLDDASGLYFNLSHSRDRAVLAVSSIGELGADIEFMDEKLQWSGIADLIFTARERGWVRADPVSERARFYTIWTRKEAVAKANGGGFSLDFKSFCTLGDERGPHAEVPEHRDRDGAPCPASIWRIRDLEIGEGYACAIAFQSADPLIRVRDFQAENWPSRQSG